MSSSAPQKWKRESPGNGESGRARHHGPASAAAPSSSSPSSSRFPFLFLVLSLLLLPALASAQQQQQVDPSVVEAIGAATLAGDSGGVSVEGENGAAFASSTSNSTKKMLSEAEKQAKLDRVLSFLSAGNIFVGNYQPYRCGKQGARGQAHPGILIKRKRRSSQFGKTNFVLSLSLSLSSSLLSPFSLSLSLFSPSLSLFLSLVFESRVVRRRVEEWVECRYNGTLTSRGVGIEESLPDVARLAFAFLADTKEEVADAALEAYARINSAIADAGFVGLAAALNAASSDVSLSPIKFVLPQDAGEGGGDGGNNGNGNNGGPSDSGSSSGGSGSSESSGSSGSGGGAGAGAGADGNPDTPNPLYLVEVRVVLRSQDAPHLELGSSAALEAAVLAGGERFAASSSVFELSPLRLSQMFNAARVKANEDMLYALISDAAQLGVLLGPLDEYAPERR